jgi:hypothetical protein
VADQGSLRIYDCLPNFLGGKRQQARAIFTAVAQAGGRPGMTFLDPFMGGGSIALTAKRLGYRVLAADTAPGPEAIGKALIENDRRKLTREDALAALEHDPEGWYLPPLKQLPWPEESRLLLGSLCSFAETFEDPMRRHMMRAWMVKFATFISLYGQPRMTAHERIRNKNWDAMTPGQVTRVLEPQTRPRKMALRAAEDLYDAPFPNGQRNEMQRADAVEFIANHPGDVLYVDPPYPDTEGYGRNYVGIDAILENRELSIDEGRFASPQGWRHLADVLAAAAHVPVVLLSLGAETKHLGVDELVELMHDAGRDPDVLIISKYRLLRSRATDKSDRKAEYLILGTRPK